MTYTTPQPVLVTSKLRIDMSEGITLGQSNKDPSVDA